MDYYCDIKIAKYREIFRTNTLIIVASLLAMSAWYSHTGLMVCEDVFRIALISVAGGLTIGWSLSVMFRIWPKIKAR